mmetsp:Transcript_31677/g.97913  ORF Transcript_31677/g.97913 Transcript_31677/m.97913 type:complete len:140 (+) Transcript_31677:838-1257(+)
MAPAGKKDAPKTPNLTLEDWGRHVAFGVICGSLTGFTVGAVDAFRMVKSGAVPRADAARVAFHEMGRSAVVVSAFFSVYQTVKCLCLAADVKYPEVRVGSATAIAIAPVSVIAPLRRLVPYCLTLVAVDTYHTFFAPDR